MHNHNSQGPHFEVCRTMRISVTEAINGPRKCQHECKHTHTQRERGGCRQDDIERERPNDSQRIRTEADNDNDDVDGDE